MGKSKIHTRASMICDWEKQIVETKNWEHVYDCRIMGRCGRNGVLTNCSAEWLSCDKNLRAWITGLSAIDFKPRDYRKPHGDVVDAILPPVPPEKEKQIRYEKYIEIWLHKIYGARPLPVTLYNSSLCPEPVQNAGLVLKYELFLREGTGQAIDLISSRKINSSPTLLLLELKAGCSHESLLRCLTEAYTYYKLIKDERNFIEAVTETRGSYQLAICPLFFDGRKSRPNQDFSRMLDTKSAGSVHPIQRLVQKIEEMDPKIKVYFAQMHEADMAPEILEWLKYEKSKLGNR